MNTPWRLIRCFRQTFSRSPNRRAWSLIGATLENVKCRRSLKFRVNSRITSSRENNFMPAKLSAWESLLPSDRGIGVGRSRLCARSGPNYRRAPLYHEKWWNFSWRRYKNPAAKGRVGLADRWIKMEMVERGVRWSTVHQASRFTGLQIELARRNIGGRVQGAYRDLQVRGVRGQPFLPHYDRKGQDGSSR